MFRLASVTRHSWFDTHAVFTVFLLTSLIFYSFEILFGNILKNDAILDFLTATSSTPILGIHWGASFYFILKVNFCFFSHWKSITMTDCQSPNLNEFWKSTHWHMLAMHVRPLYDWHSIVFEQGMPLEYFRTFSNT